MKPAQQYAITKFGGNDAVQVDDWIAVEAPLEIWIKFYDSNKQALTQALSVTMRTPGDDLDLVRGWLFATLGLGAEHLSSIRFTGVEHLQGQPSNRILVTLLPSITFDPNVLARTGVSQSSCGVCGQQSIEALTDNLSPILSSNRLHLRLSQIIQMPNALINAQSAFKKTGGIHSAALFDTNAQLLDVREDVGRHNALDKLIGGNLARLPGPYGVLLSGRVSFEMVQKTARAGISLIIAIGAPTSLAIDLCREWDIGLIGFVKQNGVNVYHGPAPMV